jgi:hypothetical protein
MASQSEDAFVNHMRKGTRSCVECTFQPRPTFWQETYNPPGRKRKTRCTYMAEHGNRCVECYSRGLDCLDQRAVPRAPPTHRRNLRERVSQLEDGLAALRREVNSKKGFNGQDISKLTMTI